MPRNLLPLTWVRAFEASARHEGFLRVSEEPEVSVVAVSQMVKTLETHLGTPFFKRLARSVRLMENGRAYLGELTPALDRISRVSERVRVEPPTLTLRVAVLPALAEKWLTPRLSNFHDVHPHLTVKLSAVKDLSKPTDGVFGLAY